MRLLFCSDPTDERTPDPAFMREVTAATELGLEIDLLSHDAAATGKMERAVAQVSTQPPESTVYRGWMLRSGSYSLLHDTLLARGRRLVNSPEQYEHCHHLPASYEVIREHTPRTVWLPMTDDFSMDDVMSLLATFGDRPLVLKDFVKSQKHAWKEACFIPAADDRAQVERVVRRFVAMQGRDLVGGLVFREYVELEQVGVHPKSGLPLSREFRLFYVDGRLVQGFRYWDEGDYGSAPLELPSFESVASSVRSRFFSMDVARSAAGQWLIIELGDGQVAGLPDTASPRDLFAALKTSL
jgi:ATP-grasp domain, R2K clade family 3